MGRTLTQLEAAYVAGIIDGEGCVSVTYPAGKDRGKPYLHPIVRVTNTDFGMIRLLRDWTETGAVSARSGQRPWHRGAASILWASGDAVDFLRQVYPFLHTKRPQAELVLSLADAEVEAKQLENVKKFNGSHPAPLWLVDFRNEISVAVHLLNKRGLL